MKKYRMVTAYYVHVDSRTFERTESEVRKDELLELLPGFFPDAEIWAEEKRERKYA